MPYQVLAIRSGAAAVTVTWTRSARARSSGVILAMLSRSACRPSAFWAPFLPSARSSSARAFMAARSSALKPSDVDVALFAGMPGLPFLDEGKRSGCPSSRRLEGVAPAHFSIPDRFVAVLGSGLREAHADRVLAVRRGCQPGGDQRVDV